MFRAARLLLAGALLVVCNGCASNDRTAREVRGCVRTNDDYEKAGPFRRHLSHDAFRTMLRRICVDAQERGLVDEENLTLDGTEIREVIVTRPRLFYPFCRAIALTIRDGIGVDAQRYLTTATTDQAGRRLCDLGIGGGFVSEGGSLTPALERRLARRHPEVFRPFCVADALAEYEQHPDPRWTLADARRLFTRICTAALRRGIVRPTGEADEAALTRLARRIEREMRARGELR